MFPGPAKGAWWITSLIMMVLHIKNEKYNAKQPHECLGKLFLNTTRVHVPTVVVYKLFYYKRTHLHVWMTRAWVVLWFMGREHTCLYLGVGPIDTCDNGYSICQIETYLCPVLFLHIRDDTIPKCYSHACKKSGRPCSFPSKFFMQEVQICLSFA